MDSIPPELFTEIIDLTLDPSSHEPIGSWRYVKLVSRLSQLEKYATVSQSWRTTIYNQSPLWSTISSSDPLNLVEKALVQSRDSSLSINISQLPVKLDFNDLEEQFTSHCRHFLRLVNEHVHRWGSADWIIPFISLFEEFPTSPALMLRSFSLSADGYVRFPQGRFKWERSTSPPNVFGGVVPSLRSLSLSMARLGWPATSYGALRRLTIRCETYSNTITGDYILDVLEAASSSLEELTFQLDIGGYSGSDTGHTAEIEETEALVEVSKPRNPPIQMSKLRLLEILELRDIDDIVLHFHGELCTNVKIATLPIDWSPQQLDPGEAASVIERYKKVDAIYRKYISRVIAAIPPDDLVYRLEGSTRTWPSWHEGKLSVFSRTRPDVRFEITESRPSHMTWIAEQLPVGFIEGSGLELRPVPGWTPHDFTVYTAIPEMEMVKRLVVRPDCSAAAILQALCNPYTPHTGGVAWLLPFLTDLELGDRASPELVEYVRTTIKHRQGLLEQLQGEKVPEVPAARLRRVEMLVTEPGDAGRLAELRDFLDSM